MDMNDAVDVAVVRKAAPPTVITVDPNSTKANPSSANATYDSNTSIKSEQQAANAQTPKHANHKEGPSQQHLHHHQQHSIAVNNSFPPGHRAHHGAFGPPRLPMQVSPGSRRYYAHAPPHHQHHHHHQLRTAGGNNHSNYDYAYDYNGYGPQRTYPQAPPLPSHHYGYHEPPYHPAQARASEHHVSRAVSSSFDRTNTVQADDASWGQLHQVTSVDEEELLRRRASKQEAHTTGSHSNSSSLTNSPTHPPNHPPPKLSSSLDSLSSVASAQVPILLPAIGEKRRPADARQEENEVSAPEKEVRIAPPPLKKGKKSSPLSITCSPPSSPHNKMSKLLKEPTSTATMDSFYDKPPVFAYSMESAPPLPQRPGSSSSTMTPMNVDEKHPVVGQASSWEIQPQDSFGNGQGGLMSSFSFTQEYPMMHEQALESRNQSFDGYPPPHHFARSDSMMSYEGPYEPRQQYHGPFPPHAPSWGSSASYQQGYPPPYYPQPPLPMRNYSEDSRASPPPRLHRGPPFPPPEFRAPPSKLAGPQQQQQHIMSQFNHNNNSNKQAGTFGWGKEEDARLTDIMKKYKNPRDWNPIAKELACGRSAKECHERWIRYLKPGVRKGQWTDHEDAIVVEMVSTSTEQPFTRWSDLAQRLPGRVGKQIRDRWVNHLNPNINHLPFSREDDLNLWEGHKQLGKRWVEISTKFFTCSRSENHIKNRWYSASFKKFITNEFGPDAYSGGKSGSPSDKKKKKRAEEEIEV
jgi:hypothetical protein